MILLSANRLTKTIAGDPLFEDSSFSVLGTDKIGFVGVNGAGKSTLFRMIAENEDYDSGGLSKSKDVRIGYLEQHVATDGTGSVVDEMLTLFSEVVEVERQIDDICLKLKDADSDMEALILRQAALNDRFIQLDGAYYRSKIKSVLSGLGFTEEETAMQFSDLSGGQKTRIALAKILLSDANLLLLDEPTNHLDIDSIEWLENFLANYKGAFVVISHDRYFLDKVTNRTLAFENKRVRTYDGNYSAYAAQREIERLTEQRNYEQTTSEISRLEEVAEQQRRWKHKKNKKTHTMDNTRHAIERLEKTLIEPEAAPDSMSFRFEACEGGGRNVLMAEGLGLSFGANKLFENVDLHIEKGEKVFVLGPNGCGKTSLIKIFMGLYEQTSGKCRIGENVRIGYYDQLKENVCKEKTVLDEVWDEHPDRSQTEVRGVLARFLLRGDDVFKKVGSLSGGELARLELAKLLLKNANFLIMDEPTNHLDIVSREALEDALSDYGGTMLMVSHDRYFINKLADRVLYLTPDGLVEYSGGYDDFRAARKPSAQESASNDKKTTESLSKEERKQSQSQRRKVLNRNKKLEGLIEATESDIAKLEKEYEDPEISSDYIKLYEISQRLDSLRQDLDAYYDEWESLQEKVNLLE